METLCTNANVVYVILQLFTVPVMLLSVCACRMEIPFYTMLQKMVTVSA